MKKQIEIHVADWQVGDVIVRSTGPFDLIVEREIAGDPHEPGTMLEFTDGTRAFKAAKNYADPARPERDWRLLYDDGSTSMFSWETIAENYTVASPLPVKPAITRDLFIETINSVVDNNGLEVGKHFATAVIYTADRLGLY